MRPGAPGRHSGPRGGKSPRPVLGAGAASSPPPAASTSRRSSATRRSQDRTWAAPGCSGCLPPPRFAGPYRSAPSWWTTFPPLSRPPEHLARGLRGPRVGRRARRGVHRRAWSRADARSAPPATAAL